MAGEIDNVSKAMLEEYYKPDQLAQGCWVHCGDTAVGIKLRTMYL